LDFSNIALYNTQCREYILVTIQLDHPSYGLA